MSSSVHFKFKSQREPSRVTFDGTGISVFELKREIISQNRLGDGTDFELSIYNEDTGEEYDDDTTIIPRSTSVIARRLPAARPGKGGAARYVSGKMPVNARSTGRADISSSSRTASGAGNVSSNGVSELDSAQTEEEKIKALFNLQANQWKEQQQEMANATPVAFGRGRGKPVNIPDHPPPPGYLCYRCREKGHWIQACPTNNDPKFDGRYRVKRSTGIPRSLQTKVDKPDSLTLDGSNEELKNSGVMVNADGDFVIAQPDKAAWELYQEKAKASAAAAAEAAAAEGSRELQARGLECPIDKRMFLEPTKTPCCGKTYCNDCITNALIESDFVCPGCSSEGVLLDNLTVDEEAVAKIKSYEAEKAERREKEKEKQQSVREEQPHEQSEKEPSKSPRAKQTSSPSLSNGIPSAQTKKRPAEDEPDKKDGSPRTDSVPMKKQKSEDPKALVDKTEPQSKSATDAFPRVPFEQAPFGGAGFMPPQGMPAMPFPPENGFMPAAAMGFMNPMMFPGGNGYMGNMDGGWNQMNGMDFMSQQNRMYNANMNAPMPNHPFGPNMYNGMGGNSMGMGAMGQMGNQMPQPAFSQGMGMDAFANQQRTAFGAPYSREEDNAYFRQPVNPHRHQARQRRVRPSDYREL
ncbi:hypothetical protein AN7431.2 [Paecilomyces variotii No. 5]|uniref:Retinoblastoma-binding protein n=1 Tax=Byssochlamys spectabilis (strain No. 5 / NBRC 109023) TaxID=1356009 RepID=V5GCJ1_BYSSN|nr:hypothetical protein AN7431.2 [Paecilomyces variotii No. 5]